MMIGSYTSLGNSYVIQILNSGYQPPIHSNSALNYGIISYQIMYKKPFSVETN